MSNDYEQDQRGRAGAHGSASDARTAAPASAPSSNYGAKEDEISLACPEGFRGECEGERVEFFTTGKHSYHVRYPVPDESADRGAALIDWLAFTLTPPLQIALMARLEGCEEAGYRWMVGELVRLFNVDGESIERKKGRFGFKHSAQFSGGLIAWGGESQRGKVMVSLSGEGCARIEDWPTVAAWLESHAAALKRVDLAYDDFSSETLSIEKVVSWYRSDGFNAGGRKPGHRLDGDWLDGADSAKGRTLYVGNRKNGKLFRAYEKGKQLGDPASRWVRVECEWHDKSRWLPYDMLTRPGQYLSGAYPCLRFLHIEQSKVKTVFRSAKVVFDRAMDNLRQQGGKLINLAMSVYGGDYAAVVDRLKRDGIPARIEPYSYHVRRAPEMLDVALVT